MQDIIIDTDPGHDDAMAIMLAVRSGEFKVRMICTVAGNSVIENTTRNARHILKLLGREDIPVYSGATGPLKRVLKTAFVHGKSGLEGIDPKNEPMLTGDAADKMLECIGRSLPITLITLGPLTNVATAILKDPKTMSKLKGITMMGGAIDVPGNQDGISEFNMFVDPDAADVVFRSGIPLTVVPLDACNPIVLSLQEFKRLKGSDLYEPVMAMVRPYIRNTLAHQGTEGAFMYDPLAVYAVLRPDACRFEDYAIKVDITDAGRGRFDCTKYGSVKVAMAIDGRRFTDDFFRMLRNAR